MYLVKNVVFIPECPVRAIQDDITAMHHIVKHLKFIKDFFPMPDKHLNKFKIYKVLQCDIKIILFLKNVKIQNDKKNNF